MKVVGDPDTVESQVRATLDLFGDVEPSLSVLWGNLSAEASQRSLRLFAEAVMPRFQPVAVRQQQAGSR